MPDAEYVAESVDFLVQRDGADWCVLEAHALRGRYGSRDDAVRAAALAARQAKQTGIYARILVSLGQMQATR